MMRLKYTEHGLLYFYSICSMHQDNNKNCSNCQHGSWGLIDRDFLMRRMASVKKREKDGN